MIIELLTVGLLAAVDLWLALPAAYALPIPHAASAVAMAIGGCIGAFVAAFAATQISSFVQARYAGYDRLLDRTRGVLDKYGLPGIGLTAPIVLGPVLTTVTAIALGANPRKLMFWIVVGTVAWSLLFYLALAFGASFD